MRTLKENAEALVADAREIGLKASADKTKYMVMSRHQNAGRSQNIKTDNSSLEGVVKVHPSTGTEALYRP